MATTPDYVPDRLYSRLFQPWTLPESEWPLCREDWARVDAITALPWHGKVLDVGAGDGTLGSLVCSRNPRVTHIWCQEPDAAQVNLAQERWVDAGWPMTTDQGYPVGTTFDCALVAEVLEHLAPADGLDLLKRVRSVMVKGGMLCVTTPVPGGSRAEYAGHINVMGMDALLEMTEAAGFRSDVSRWVPPLGGVKPTIWQMVIARA